VSDRARAMARAPGSAPKAPATQVVKKSNEIDRLCALMKSGTLSQAVGQAAIEKAEEEL
jgi:hypothetical protein